MVMGMVLPSTSTVSGAPVLVLAEQLPADADLVLQLRAELAARLLRAQVDQRVAASDVDACGHALEVAAAAVFCDESHWCQRKREESSRTSHKQSCSDKSSSDLVHRALSNSLRR
jgi:hypothetical protein